MPAVVNEIEPCAFNALGDFAHNLGWRQRILATRAFSMAETRARYAAPTAISRSTDY
jgi:hypothetical protein